MPSRMAPSVNEKEPAVFENAKKAFLAVVLNPRVRRLFYTTHIYRMVLYWHENSPCIARKVNVLYSLLISIPVERVQSQGSFLR